MTEQFKFLNVREVAEITGISRSTLNKYRREGRTDGPPSFKIGGRVVYPLAQLSAWTEQRLAGTMGGGL